jgi:purine nucleoside phosphorylase
VIAMSTDYDSWHEAEKAVDIRMVLQIMAKNAENVKQLLIKTVPRISHESCDCMEQAKSALI